MHLAAIALNQALGNVGKTVVYTETVQPLPSIQLDDLKSLVADMNAGKVQWLLILDANPVYSAPVDLNFAEALGKVPKSAHLGSHVDETAQIHDLAYQQRALPRILVGCARLRWHALRHPADDRSALRRQVGARCDPDSAR